MIARWLIALHKAARDLMAACKALQRHTKRTAIWGRSHEGATARSMPADPMPPKVCSRSLPLCGSVHPRRRPRYWNIGLDFGTAFTKCVARNLATQEAFLVPLGNRSYLCPSEVFWENGRLWLSGDAGCEERGDPVRYLKMALAETALGKTAGARLDNRVPSASWIRWIERKGCPEIATLYFLARILQQARAFIVARAPDFDESKGDRCMVNLAVPVAHAQERVIASAFERCLRCAWRLARQSEVAHMSPQTIAATLQDWDAHEDDAGCSIYPEVSANVQSYIKSRAGTDGLYLFADVGAGTIDISVFLYYTHPANVRPISYLAAGVVPLGSAVIEMRAARRLARGRQQEFGELESQVRRIKEGHVSDAPEIMSAIRQAEQEIEDEVFYQVAPVLDEARRKIRREQWRTLRTLWSGGGAEAPLYRRAVNRWFQLCCAFSPEHSWIPVPSDLRWPSEMDEPVRVNLFRRFAVAYGLSFDRVNLEEHRFPSEVQALPVANGYTAYRPIAPATEEC